MKKQQSGVTVIELMIVAVIFLILSGVGVASCSSCSAGPIRAHAEKYARHYARTFLAYQQPIVECQGTDSDANGYVMCNVTERAGAPIRQIECSANIFLEISTGCRAYGLRTLDVNGQPVQLQNQ